MEPLALESLRSEIQRLARLIDAPSRELPTFGRTQDGARPHIEVDDRGYHWVVVERGQEYQRVTSRNVDEILYCTFQSVTFDMRANMNSHIGFPDRIADESSGDVNWNC